MGALEDFKKFIAQGNVVSIAVAFIIAAAFTLVVGSLVTNIILPVAGIPGHVDFSQRNVTVGGSVISYGLFVNAVIDFIIVALVVFFGIVRPMAKLEERRKARQAAEPPTTKDCPFCFGKIPIKATKCQFCTSTLP